MCLAQFAFTRRLLGSASSATSATVDAQCTQVHTRGCCCSRRVLRARSNRLTTGAANYTSRSLSHPPNWPTGSRGSKREESLWKRSGRGTWEAGASTFETRTAICSNSLRRAHGRSIEKRCPVSALSGIRLAGRPQCDEGFGCSAALLPERSRRICPERSQRVRSAFSISAGGVGFLLGVKSVLRMGNENSQSRLPPPAEALARAAIRFKFQIRI